MQDFGTTEMETVSMEGQESCPTYAVHVGLDVHKDSIAVALPALPVPIEVLYL